MTLSHLKSICIVLLAALTIYQTGMLWFMNITNRNFLLVFFPFLHQTAIPEGYEILTVPWRLLTVDESGQITAGYNGLGELERGSSLILSQLMQNGNYEGVRALDEEAMRYFISQPAYIYEYAFSMEAEWFTLGFGQRSNVLTSRVTAPFRQVVVRPGQSEARVFFLCENDYVYEFSVAYGGGMAPSAEGPSYALVEGNFVRQGEFEFYGLSVSNPYDDAHGGFLIDTVMDHVAGFFSNPAAIRPIIGDVWVFIDANTVVRYYATHVFEYISYRAIDRNLPSSFIDNFSAAHQFVERDHLIVNETYLAGFRIDGPRHVFYFDYVIGNMPLLMPSNWPRGSPMVHPITVTVEHGTVVRYRKLAFNFFLDEEVQLSVNADFNALSARLPEDFTSIKLGYRMSDEDSRNLFWFVDGREFLVGSIF